MEMQEREQKKELPAAVTILLLLLAIALCLLGIHQGETAEVFRKAANICMECIGLG